MKDETQSRTKELATKLHDYTHTRNFEHDVDNEDARILIRKLTDILIYVLNSYSTNSLSQGFIYADRVEYTKKFEAMKDLVRRGEKKAKEPDDHMKEIT